MSRRKNILATSSNWERATVTGAEPDHLKGQHVEDFLSRDSQYHFQPDTPMQSAFMGPVQDDCEAREKKFVREFYGATEARRRAWLDVTDPGGHTFERGEFLDD